MKCPHCQEEHPSGTEICPNTGLPIEEAPSKPQTNQKSNLRNILAVLAVAVIAVGGYFLADHYGLFSAATADNAIENSETAQDDLAGNEAQSDTGEAESTPAADAMDAPETIATVNGMAIANADFQRRVHMQRGQLVNEYVYYYQVANSLTDAAQQEQYFSYLDYLAAMMEQETIGTAMLNQMIDEIFIVEEAQARGITVTEQEIDDYYYGLFGYYPNGVPTTTPDDGTETDAEPQTTSISEEEFNTANSAYLENLKEYDIDETFVRELVRVTLYRDKLVAELEKGINSEEEQVWARHILLEDEATALDVLDQLENGADFVDLAAEYSIGPTATTGGDLGWFSRGTMVQAFEDAAFSGEVGDLVGPVETQFGFHIIEILGKEMRPVDASTLSSLVNASLSGILDDYLTNAQIDYADNWIEYTPTDPNISDILGSN